MLDGLDKVISEQSDVLHDVAALLAAIRSATEGGATLDCSAAANVSRLARIAKERVRGILLELDEHCFRSQRAQRG